MNKLAKICSAAALATAMLGGQAAMASGSPSDNSNYRINIKNNSIWDIWITYYHSQDRGGGQAGSQCVAAYGGTNNFSWKGWATLSADARFEVKETQNGTCGGRTFRDDEINSNFPVDSNGNMLFTATKAPTNWVSWTQGYK